MRQQVATLQYHPSVGIGPNAMDDGRHLGGVTPPASPLHLEPLPRNVWQVMPRWHIYALYAALAFYFLILAILTGSCLYVLFRVDDLRGNCDENIFGFLIAFVCSAASLLVLGTALVVLFAVKFVPRFLKSAKPISDGWHCYGIVTGILVFAAFVCSIFGLYAAPFKDQHLEARCRLPVRVIQASSITFIAQTLLLLVAVFVHRRVMGTRLSSIQHSCCRPPQLPPMPGSDDILY